MYKCVNQVWLRYDNEIVKKANLSGQFRINLAFFRHINSSTAVKYVMDFAVIKQSRAKRSVTFAVPTEEDLPEKLPKLYSSKLGQKSIRSKSSAIPSTSHQASIDNQDANVEIPIVSQVDTSVGTPSVVSKPATTQAIKIGIDVSGTQCLDFEQQQSIPSTGNVSAGTASNLVITNVRSFADISSPEVTYPSPSGGLSAEDLPPLELNKRLHVSIERYPNLLKRFQEGKVKIRKEIEQDVRLTAIKSKKVTSEVFSKFLNDTPSAERPGKSVASSEPHKVGDDSGSNPSSSEDEDNTEDDEDYVPDPSDLGPDPNDVNIKKSKSEGTYMSHMYSNLSFNRHNVGMSASAPLNF